MPKKRITALNEDFDLKLFLTIVKKKSYWIFFLLAFSLSLAYLYLRYTPPLYQSSSQIKLGLVNNANAIISTSIGNPFFDQSQSQLAGAIELIKSKIIVERALSKIPLAISYYSRGTVLVKEIYTQSPYSVEVNIKDSSIYNIPINVEFITDHVYQLSYFFNGKKEVSDFNVGELIHLPPVDLTLTINNIDAINKLQNQLKKNAYYFIINDPDLNVQRYMSNVVVSILNSQAQTMQILYKDYNPIKAADFVNSIASEFISYDQEKQSEGSDKILAFIEQTLQDVDIKLKNSETQLEDFKKSNKVLNPERNAERDLSLLTDIENQQTNEKLNLLILEKIEKDVKNSNDLVKLLPFLAGGYNDNVISGLVNNIQQLENERDKLKLQATESNQAVKDLNARIEKQRQLLVGSITNAKIAVGQKVLNNQNRIGELDADFMQLPVKEAQLSRLDRTFKINEKFFSLLLEKKAEFSITKAGLVSNNIVLQRAYSNIGPVSPNRTLIFTASILIGLLISFLIIFVNYLFYNEITSLDEVNQYTDAALLGIVPRYKSEIPVSQLIVDKNPKSAISESFRSVRTNLQFISNAPEAKVIAVTSTISGEGKTFCAINLAGVIAFSNKRVVIIDLDMRKPKIHLGFNVENIRGMSTILIGRDLPENCINKSSLKNLDFITAGPIPPNPSELILSPKMGELLEYLKSIYDIIIIDTPPVGIVTDGVHAIQQADFPIYILRGQYSKRMFIQNINKLMDENKIRKLSIVLNGVEMSKFRYGYGYGYGYGFGYGYGYGYYDDETKRQLSPWRRLKNAFRRIS